MGLLDYEELEPQLQAFTRYFNDRTKPISLLILQGRSIPQSFQTFSYGTKMVPSSTYIKLSFARNPDSSRMPAKKGIFG